jgi:hypothetical protein
MLAGRQLYEAPAAGYKASYPMKSYGLGKLPSRSLAISWLALALAAVAACAGSTSGSGETTEAGGTSDTGAANDAAGAGDASGESSIGQPDSGGGGADSGGTTDSSATNDGGGGADSGSTTDSGGMTGSDCPSNATFCSGFEMQGLPTGAIYMVNAAPGDWSRDFAIDTTQHHSGNSSLLTKSQSAAGSSGSAYRMLAVPGTPNAFWVRFWIESDMPIGGTEHNAFAGGSTDDTPNGLMIEFAEDVGVAFNTQDSDQWPTGYGRLSGGGTKPYTLPAMTWECIEISYDGTGKEQQLFINNVQLIDAKGYPANTEALTYFKFGFNALHGPARQVWYDDVAVAPTRMGDCPTVAMSNM